MCKQAAIKARRVAKKTAKGKSKLDVEVYNITIAQKH